MNSKMNKGMVVCFILLLALVLVPVSGWSEEQGMEREIGQVEVSDEEILSFAKAQQEVLGIQQEYTDLAAQAADVDKQKEIVQEANEKMVEAVEDEGFSVQRYNVIANAMQSDTALQQRIIAATQKLK